MLNEKTPTLIPEVVQENSGVFFKDINDSRSFYRLVSQKKYLPQDRSQILNAFPESDIVAIRNGGIKRQWQKAVFKKEMDLDIDGMRLDIYWRYIQFSVFDMEVWSSLVQMSDDNFHLETSKYAILKKMGMRDSAEDYKKLEKSIDILVSTPVMFVLVRKSHRTGNITEEILYGGNLISRFKFKGYCNEDTYNENKTFDAERGMFGILKSDYPNDKMSMSFLPLFKSVLFDDLPIGNWSYINTRNMRLARSGTAQLLIQWFSVNKCPIRKSEGFFFWTKEDFYKNFLGGNKYSKKRFFSELRNKIVPDLYDLGILLKFKEDKNTVAFRWRRTGKTNDKPVLQRRASTNKE